VKAVAATRSIDDVLRDIKAALAQLESTVRAWETALPAAIPDARSPEFAQIENLLQDVTHETPNALAFLVRDIEALLARSRVRQAFPAFTPEQLQRIVERGWSTTLAQELHPEFPALGLPALSAQIKQLCAAWGKIPAVACKRSPDAR
jgi:hypothetical protein